MKLRSALAALAVSVSFVVPGCVAPAAAEDMRVPCGPLAPITEKLAKQKQVLVAAGTSGDSATLIYASPGGKKWTLLFIDTNGAACVMAEGTGWFHEDIPPAGQEV